jgi:hypothetical protein
MHRIAPQTRRLLSSFRSQRPPHWPTPLAPPTPAITHFRHLTSSATVPEYPPREQDPPPKQRRPSPYRLIPTRTFLAQFAPLHVAGWRLEKLPSIAAAASLPGRKGAAPKVEETGDLQDYCLTRAFSYEQTREGWEGAMRLVQRLVEVVADEDVSGLGLVGRVGGVVREPRARKE